MLEPINKGPQRLCLTAQSIAAIEDILNSGKDAHLFVGKDTIQVFAEEKQKKYAQPKRWACKD